MSRALTVVCVPAGRTSLDSEIATLGASARRCRVAMVLDGGGIDLALGEGSGERVIVWTIGMDRASRSEISGALRALGWGVELEPDLCRRRGTGVEGVIAAGGPPDWSRLIDRTPHALDDALVRGSLEGRRVLVTGAGGSIGSELARLVSGFGPAELVCMDRSENALFEIDRQLARMAGGVARRAVLHDIADESATRRVIGELRPEVVFHAAAHKHVPLMEDHPGHAVVNNVLGTHVVASAAIDHGAGRFVLISSDKAVNPSSVMGATKRLAELCLAWVRRDALCSGRRLSAPSVRFGNVLGSAGSVLPIWSAQLAEGGPLTVTDPRMTRYFMTIREAATLVLQAAAMDDPAADASPTYVLDMGEPVKILDMAERFVALHGKEARVVGGMDEHVRRLADEIRGEDRSGRGDVIDVVITGARPGEKLHEELAYAAERVAATSHDGIGAWNPEDDPAEGIEFGEVLRRLGALARRGDRDGVLSVLRELTPTLRAESAAGVRRAG